MSIYTKAGDTGRASTLTRKNIPKDSPVFQLLGTLDELNSVLGHAKLTAVSVAPIIEQLQNDVVALSGELAGGKRFADREQVVRLEQAIDAAASGLTMPEKAVLPGGTVGGAALDVARAVARRAERCALTSSQTGGITRDTMAWLNRLSDLLYTLARLCDCSGTPASEAGKTMASPVSSANVEKPAAETALVSDGFCDDALKLCQAVRQYAAEQGVRVVTAVCDAGGNPVAMLRSDDAFIASVDIAMNKAFTSVSLKMSTEDLAGLAQPGQSLYGIQFTNQGRIVIFGGGVPLLRDGKIVGGFGVSGGTAEQDSAFGQYASNYFIKEMG